MARSSAEPPLFVIVAGPNGSGKSSAYTDAASQLDGRTVWIVNPDLLTATIRDVEKLELREANLAAVQRIEAWLESSMRVHKSVGVETVLSTSKYRRLVDMAKGFGFEVWLIYVILNRPELNIQRVRLRVTKGGHDVPEDAIRRRYANSLAQMPWFAEAADVARFYDNSGSTTRLVGLKQNGVLQIDGDAPAALLNALSA